MEIRISEPKKKLKAMYGHTGVCHYCNGPVKMFRDQRTFKLLPNQCQCMRCGQPYFMEIENIEEWEINQWDQKDKLG